MSSERASRSGLARKLRAGAARVEGADVALGVGLAGAKDSRAVRAVGLTSEAGGGWKALLAVSAAALALGLARGDPRLAEAGRHMLASGILAGAAKMALKRAVHRTRPNVLMDTGLYARGWGGPAVGPWQSFPSGHAALSVAVARAAARAWPGLRNEAAVAAGLVLAAQMVRGAHFPADVLAGAAIGLAAEACADRLAPGREAVAVRSGQWP